METHHHRDAATGRDGVAQLALAAPRRPWSVLELVGNEDAMSVLLAFVGFVGEEEDALSLGDGLAYGRVLPGVRVRSRIKVGPAGAKLLAMDACLRELRLQPRSSWPHVMGALELNARLERLDLRNCGLKPRDVEVLAEALLMNSSLADLDLRRNDVGSAGGRALATVLESNATLRVLRLGSCSLGDVGGRAVASGLASNGGLRELDVSRNDLRGTSARALAAALVTSNASLRKLDIFDNRLIGDEAGAALIRSLLVNRSLQELNVGETGLRQASGSALAEVMRANSTLQALDLFSSWLGHDVQEGGSWPQVLAALKANVGLHTLRLGLCSLTPAEGQQLASALHKRPRGLLRELNLRGNRRLEDNGCGAVLSACLGPGSAVRTLDLHNAGMGRAARLSLARCLRATSALTALDFSYCKLGSDNGSSWAEVFAALAVNTGLQTLKLVGCGLNARDAKALSAALETNCVLQELHLWVNGLGDDGACALAAGLAAAPHTALRRLDLRVNDLCDTAAHAFADLLLLQVKKEEMTALTLSELTLWRNVGIGPAAREELRSAGRAAGCSVQF